MENQIKQGAEYCMKIGALLGVIYIVQYYFLIQTSHNVFFSVVHTLLSIFTPFMLALSSYRIRKNIFTEDFSWGRCWSCGVRICFYASLIEACFIVVYNQWINPYNLYEMQQGLIAQYESLNKMVQASGNDSFTALNSQLEQVINTIKEQEVQTPIDAALGAVTTDLFSGVFWMTLLASTFYRKK